MHKFSLKSTLHCRICNRDQLSKKDPNITVNLQPFCCQKNDQKTYVLVSTILVTYIWRLFDSMIKTDFILSLCPVYLLSERKANPLHSFVRKKFFGVIC